MWWSLSFLGRGRGDWQAEDFGDCLGSKCGYNLQMFTDGSKDPVSSRVAMGLVIPYLDYSYRCRIQDHSSEFTADLVAVLCPLRRMEEHVPACSIICSDSTATLEALSETSCRSGPDLLASIGMLLHKLSTQGCEVCFVWIPAHVGM
uniref:Uncharacterized protein n=1 Tax=Nothobranchius furzeri TaxID=105023 RepID=A0A1A8A3S8_NOTFU